MKSFRMPEIILSEAQKNALCHDTGPAIVFAGPGSGKTLVLTGRVGHLIKEKGVSPSTILVITYTKAAALSMQQRFIREMKGKVFPVTFGTFHAVFYHILQEHYHFKTDCLLAESGRKLLLYPILKEQHIDPAYAENILSCISLCKNGRNEADLPLPLGMSPGQFSQVYHAYVVRAQAGGRMDFDDMLLKCRTFLEHDRQARKKWQQCFRYLLADEFQDSNRIQYDILKMLAYPQDNLFVVGDDDQAIYGFRGASPDIMKQFLMDFPHAMTYFLEENYRCCREIVDVSGKVISCNQNRTGKRIYAVGSEKVLPGISGISIKGLEDKSWQHIYLTKRIRFFQEWFPLKEMAVICRTNAEIESMVPYLVNAGIPFSRKGQSKSRYAQFMIQDMYAYLRLAVSKKERSTFLKIANRPDRRIDRECMPEEELDWDGMIELCKACGQMKQAEAIGLLKRQLDQLSHMSPALAMQFVRRVIGYEDWLRKKAGKDAALFLKWTDLLDEIGQEAKLFADIPSWLSYVENACEDSGVIREKNDNGIHLMTLHAAKGLEFSYVAIPNLNEGILPHGRMLSKETIEEERRLFYVGMTRAKTALDLLYLTGTKERPRLPSRFLNPLLYDQSSESSTSSSNS